MATVVEQLQSERAERKETEEKLEQTRIAAEAAAERFQGELAERRQVESGLEQTVTELTNKLESANEQLESDHVQLQSERDERNRVEFRLEKEATDRTLEFETAVEQLKTELAEHKQTESTLEQTVAERTQELATVVEQLQAERAERTEAEEKLEQAVTELTLELENVTEELQDERDELIHAEKSLSEAENMHLGVIQSAMDGFWLAGRLGHLLEVNNAYCELSGYSEQELLSMHVNDLEASDPPEDIASYIHGETSFETRHRRKDGSVFDVELTVRRQDDGDGHVLFFLRDLTESKRLEESLRTGESLEQTVAERLLELEALTGQLHTEQAGRKDVEEKLEQARIAAEAAAERFQAELAGRRQVESDLEQTITGFTQKLENANEQLQAERDERSRVEFRLEKEATDRTLEFETAVELLKAELAEHKQAESILEQTVAERTQELATVVEQLQTERTERTEVEEKLEQSRIAAEVAAEQFHAEIAERRQAEEKLEQARLAAETVVGKLQAELSVERTQLKTVVGQLQTELAEHKATGERLSQARLAAEAAAEQFQAELAEHRAVESTLVQTVSERTLELKSVAEQLEIELAELKATEEQLSQSRLAAEAAAEQFQTELTEHRLVEITLEQTVSERTLELKSVSEQLEIELAELKETEEKLEQANIATEAVKIQVEAVSEKLQEERAERRQVESSLEQVKSFSDRLFNSAPDTLLLFDPTTGKPLRWNRRFVEVSGYSDEEIGLMTAPKDFYEETSPDSAKEALINVSTGKKRFAELVLITKSGMRIPYECGVTVIQTREGRSLLMPVGRDITGRRTKSAILANMSREIRTETNGIINMNEFLLGTNLNKEQRNYAQIAHKSGESLLEYINDIVDFSYIEAGIMEIGKHDFDFKALLEDTADILAVKAASTGQELTCRIDPSVPVHLKGDPKRIREIIANVVGNAIEFTRKGKIVISAAVESDLGESVMIRISVKDSGSGKADERQMALYDPSVLLEGATTRQYGDASLGLAMCKLLVDQMGGKIGVDSIEGKGTTFWFTALLEKQDPGTVSQTSKTSGVSGKTADRRTMSDSAKKGIRILLAEDYLTNQQVALIILSKLGYQADAVLNGQEAVAALEHTNYDLVLMDCEMPKMNGFEATALIRSKSSKVRNHSVPIIALTANAFDQDREKCLDSGMNDYLTKPVRMEKLGAALDKWLMPGAPQIQSTPMLFEENELLEYLDGDLEYAKKILNYVLTKFPEHVGTLRELAKGFDAVAFHQQAETMTGLVSCTFTPALQEICFKVESAAKEGDLESARRLLPELERTALKTMEAIRSAAAKMSN